MPICIAGMHRSGTSLVTHLLHVCGLHLGDARELVPASTANPDGYWEHRRFVEINEELLRVLGGNWATPVTIPDPASAAWKTNAELAGLRESAGSLIEALASRANWGWKDPRNSLTLPFWFSQVPGLQVVICVRHPLEVASSLKRVDPNATIAGGVERWMACYERVLADTPLDGRLLTHGSAYFSNPAVEVRRLTAFAGLSAEANVIDRALAVIRPDLRRNRFTGDEVTDFELSPQTLDLYGRLCEEAGWDQTRARGGTASSAPYGAVAVEEYDRLFSARAAHSRRMAAMDARFVKQEEDFQHELAAREDELMRAMEAGTTVRGFAREYRRIVEYRRMVTNLRRVVRNVVPAGRRMLVISHGDGDLLIGPNATCFPQDSGGGYAGYYPAASLGAIAHLEALRAQGNEFLVVPTTELWWLDQYRDFGRHLRERYRALVEDPWSCTIFALQDVSAMRTGTADEFLDVVSAFEEVLQREPAILDWGTGWRLASAFPAQTVFSPPGEGQTLPYLEASVDVVAISAASLGRLGEAERVASAAVLVFPDSADDFQPLNTRWLTKGTGQLPTVSLVVALPESERESSPLLQSIRETVPERFHAETIVASDFKSGAARAAGEILVFLGAGAVALPGWLAPLLRVFRDQPQAGAAGGKILGPDGLVDHGGGVITATGTLRSVGEDEYAAGGPASDVVRTVDWCSPLLLATRRELFHELGGFSDEYASEDYSAADYCLRLRELGHDVLFQPDASIVRVAKGLSCDAPPAFVRRWAPGERVS